MCGALSFVQHSRAHAHSRCRARSIGRAGSTAEHAELRAKRMVQFHRRLRGCKRLAHLEPWIVGQQCTRNDNRTLVPSLRLITMRDDAHIICSGRLPRMSQHSVVISGASVVRSISGNKTSDLGSSASMGMLSAANRLAKPVRASFSDSCHSVRPATWTRKPLPARTTAGPPAWAARCPLRAPPGAFR